MTKNAATMKMLTILKEVSDGPKADYFYPMGGPSIRLVARVVDALENYRTADEDTTDHDYQPSSEELAEWAEIDRAMDNCVLRDKHEAIVASGSDDGCVECGYYSK